MIMVWWHPNYVYRRRLKIEAPDSRVPVSHPVTVDVDWVISRNRKVREDFADLVVVHEGEGGLTLVPTQVSAETEDESIHITFAIQRGLEPNEVSLDEYFVYYGNLDLDEPPLPVQEATDLDGWPLRVEHDDTLVTYTRPGEHWVEGTSTTRLARASVLLYASEVRLLSRVGPDKAIAEVQVDEEPWEQVDLFRRTSEELAVWERKDLDPSTIHQIRVRVSGRSNESSVGDEVNIVAFEYRKPVLAVDTGEQVSGDLVWAASVGGS